MAETAVGLFEHQETADSVVDALHASGVPASGIRVIAKPAALSVESSTSARDVDFAAGLVKDLRSMGASEYECAAYTSGLRRGNVLILASGSAAQTQSALAVMNAYDPIVVEELPAEVPVLAGSHIEPEPNPGIVLKSERSERAKGEGARVFSW